jgi:RNA polymerase sigma-70 factor, ECF subfamily
LNAREKRRAGVERGPQGKLPAPRGRGPDGAPGAGDAGAYATLYDRHPRSAYSLARKLTGEKQAAEDLAQDALIKVWRLAGSYRAERGGVRPWILTVVRNRYLDQLRAQASRHRTQQKIEAFAPRSQPTEAFKEAWREVRLGRVREVLEALPQEQNQVLALAHFSDLTHVEIAERLRLPLGTVKGRMRLGLEKLRNNSELRGIASG